MHLSRPLRRHVALTVGTLLLAGPLLSSCGFDYATNRVNTLATGVSDRSHVVDVLGAVIVADQNNQGAFVASLSNSSTTSTESVTGLSGSGVSAIRATGFKPVSLPPEGFVNLALHHAALPLTGIFTAGDTVPVTLTFSDGATSTLDVPVVTACHEYADILPSPAITNFGRPAKQSSPSASPSIAATASPYSCDYPGTDGDDENPAGDDASPLD